MCLCAQQACIGDDGIKGALRRRVGSIRQGVQAVEVGKGQQARLSKWEKARSDTHSIMSDCFSEAHR